MEGADPADELRGSIEASRKQIADSLMTLQDEVEQRLNWRRWVRKHPWEAVGAAFCVGFVVGVRPYL